MDTHTLLQWLRDLLINLTLQPHDCTEVSSIVPHKVKLTPVAARSILHFNLLTKANCLCLACTHHQHRCHHYQHHTIAVVVVSLNTRHTFCPTVRHRCEQARLLRPDGAGYRQQVHHHPRSQGTQAAFER